MNYEKIYTVLLLTFIYFILLSSSQVLDYKSKITTFRSKSSLNSLQPASSQVLSQNVKRVTPLNLQLVD